MARQIDPLLIAVMQLAEHGIHMTATLSLNGTVLSGRVIGKQNYLQKIRKQFNSHVHEENMPGLLDILGLFQDASEEAEESYLHLEQAYVVDTSTSLQPREGFWRVKLAEIDGFSFGI